MPYKIITSCIRTHACIPRCPNNAIYKAGEEWSMADGTNHPDTSKHFALSGNLTYIVPEKCNDCVGFFDEPQCVDICPAGAIVHDKELPQSVDDLLNKKKLMHG